jgi:hypothetical protein
LLIRLHTRNHIMRYQTHPQSNVHAAMSTSWGRGASHPTTPCMILVLFLLFLGRAIIFCCCCCCGCQAYLEYLTAAGKWSAAADSMPQLLKEQGTLWERWLYVFAQVGGLQVERPAVYCLACVARYRDVFPTCPNGVQWIGALVLCTCTTSDAEECCRLICAYLWCQRAPGVFAQALDPNSVISI